VRPAVGCEPEPPFGAPHLSISVIEWAVPNGLFCSPVTGPGFCPLCPDDEENAAMDQHPAVLERVGPAVLKLGYGAVRPCRHSRRIDLPPDLPVASRSEVRLMAGQSYTRLTLVALAPSGSRDESEVILEVLRHRYEGALAVRLPAGTGHPLACSHRQRRDRFRCTHPGQRRLPQRRRWAYRRLDRDVLSDLAGCPTG
jgi:hypothetical protein